MPPTKTIGALPTSIASGTSGPTQPLDATSERGHAPSRLIPLGLDQLNAGASLQTRLDTKYLVKAEDLECLASWLPAGSGVLEIEDKREFAYYSINFDTARLDCYRDAAFSRRRRFKVRTRAYLDSQLAFLEVKIRGRRGITEKQRIPHDINHLDTLTAADREFVAEVLRANGLDARRVPDLTPSLATGYERTTYLCPSPLHPTRVTADRALYWEQLRPEFEAAEHNLLFAPQLGIVETKSLFVSNPVNHLLWDRGIRPAKISKYGTGVAALDPRLPANKWHRSIATILNADRRVPFPTRESADPICTPGSPAPIHGESLT